LEEVLAFGSLLDQIQLELFGGLRAFREYSDDVLSAVIELANPRFEICGNFFALQHPKFVPLLFPIYKHLF
jgi:hypothetical protein